MFIIKLILVSIAFISLLIGLTHLISMMCRIPLIIKQESGKIPASHMMAAGIGISIFITIATFINILIV